MIISFSGGPPNCLQELRKPYAIMLMLGLVQLTIGLFVYGIVPSSMSSIIIRFRFTGSDQFAIRMMYDTGVTVTSLLILFLFHDSAGNPLLL